MLTNEEVACCSISAGAHQRDLVCVHVHILLSFELRPDLQHTDAHTNTHARTPARTHTHKHSTRQNKSSHIHTRNFQLPLQNCVLISQFFELLLISVPTHDSLHR